MNPKQREYMKIALFIIALMFVSCQKKPAPRENKALPVEQLPSALLGEWTKISKPGREITTLFTRDSMITYENGYRTFYGSYTLKNEYLTFHSTKTTEGVTNPISIRGDTLFFPMPHVFVRRTTPSVKYD